LEVLKQISSTGYLRKRLPQELVVLQGGQQGFAEEAVGFDGLSTIDEGGAVAVAMSSTTSVASGTVSLDARTKAKMQGYEGEACGECGNYTLVRNGTCMKCNTCGGTSGCS
jgi:ribonucleoside-diphosphate reductase alpha chain